MPSLLLEPSAIHRRHYEVYFETTSCRRIVDVCCVAAPLLDPRSSLTPDHRDAGGGDTLRSQTSRGTHSDASSCIMEVPEEGKEECE